LSSCGA